VKKVINEKILLEIIKKSGSKRREAFANVVKADGLYIHKSVREAIDADYRTSLENKKLSIEKVAAAIGGKILS